MRQYSIRKIITLQLFTIHCSLFTISCQSDSYQINGYARWLHDGDTIRLTDDAAPEKMLATALVSHGRFELRGQTDSITLCRVYTTSEPANGATLFLEPGELTVELNPYPTASRVSGSRINNEWQLLGDSIMLLGKQLIQHSMDNTTDTDSATHRQRLTTIDSLHRRMSDCISNTARRNSQNALGRYILEHYKAPEFD